MAINQLNYYSNIDTSIIDMQNTLDGTFISKESVSLTNWLTTTEPQIAAGSILENNGALFEVTTDTSISGSPSDGTVYIYLVPSGDPALGTATVTPTYTNTAPTWSDAKQGWYGTAGAANYRYLPFYIIKSTTSYIKYKAESLYREFISHILCAYGSLGTAGTANLTAVEDPFSEVGANTITLSKTGLYRIDGNWSVGIKMSANHQTVTTNLYINGSNDSLFTNVFTAGLNEGTAAFTSMALPFNGIKYFTSGTTIQFISSTTGSSSIINSVRVVIQRLK